MHYIYENNGTFTRTKTEPPLPYATVERMPPMPIGDDFVAILKADFSTNKVWWDKEFIEPVLTPAEQRKKAYSTEKLITYKGLEMTVDEANEYVLPYLIEGNTDVSTELSTLIISAKEQIRQKYPDEVTGGYSN